ncbi:MAG: flagellar basal body P-ring protein FlgI [Planctomycetota bacterium]
MIPRILTMILILCLAPLALKAETRIGDITKVGGIDENFLQGYGLVVGLNGKGDKGPAIRHVAQMILKKLGNEFNEKDLEAKNMAIVHVTAKLPPFARPGQKIDVTVAAQGAQSLEGGILLATHLHIAGVDPKSAPPLVMAQGAILVGNTGQVGLQNAGGNAGGASVPTVGKLVGGGLVLGGVEQNYIKEVRDKKDKVVGRFIVLVLQNANATNSSEIAKAINHKMQRELVDVRVAQPLSPGEVLVNIPESRWDNIVEFLSDIDRIGLFHVESEALVVVNEKTGNITMSGDVKLSACTVMYNQVTINIAKDQDLSQVLQQLSTVLRTKDQIEIVKQLHTAKYLRARLEVE